MKQTSNKWGSIKNKTKKNPTFTNNKYNPKLLLLNFMLKLREKRKKSKQIIQIKRSSNNQHTFLETQKIIVPKLNRSTVCSPKTKSPYKNAGTVRSRQKNKSWKYDQKFPFPRKTKWPECLRCIKARSNQNKWKKKTLQLNYFLSSITAFLITIH